MNSEITPENLHPDPTWDYYIEWHKLLRAKTQLDGVIEHISKLESATEDNRGALEEKIGLIISTLDSI